MKLDLFNFLGLNDYITKVEEIASQAGFPFYDIVKTDSGFKITVALAGYKKEQIKVTVEDEKFLIIRSLDRDEQEAKTYEKETTSTELVHSGITFRRCFRREFYLGDKISVKSAKMTDGLLVVELCKKSKSQSFTEIPVE